MAKFVGILVLCMVIAPMVTEAAITCGQVTTALAPCLNFLKGSVAAVPSPCCDGVRRINMAASTTADRQVACKCLKGAAGGIPGLNAGKAEGLPRACKVNIPYKISMSTNCDNVK